MWEKAADWYGAWEEMLPRFQGDLLIGDLNIDPSRSRRRDQKPLSLLGEPGWQRAPTEGSWSYRSYSGATSSVDHVFVRGEVEVGSAQYVAEGIAGVGPVDFAALVVAKVPWRRRWAMAWTSLGQNGSFRCGGQRLKGRGRAQLGGVLERSIDSFARYSRKHYTQMQELPFTYQERQLPTVLFPALLQAAEGVSLEQPIDRRKRAQGDSGGHGWLDYWVEQGDTVALLESKHGWINSGTGVVKKALVRKWLKALEQVNLLEPEIGDLVTSGHHAWGCAHAVIVHHFNGSKPRIAAQGESWKLHRKLVGDLRVPAEEDSFRIWDACWRLPSSFTEEWANDADGEGWLHVPAVSFVVAARPLRH